MDTVLFSNPISAATLVIFEGGRARSIPLTGKSRWSFGRACPGNTPDIPATSAIVSRSHGEFLCVNARWYYRYGGTTNATFYNGVRLYPESTGQPRMVPLCHGDLIRTDFENISSPDPRGVLILFSASPVSGTWAHASFRNRKQIDIGRDPGRCQIVLPLPYVSARHARITFVNGVYYLSDCGSKAGTWLGGRKLEHTAPLREKDSFSICDCHFIFTGEGLVFNKRSAPSAPLPSGRAAISAYIRKKVVPDSGGAGRKVLLQDIRLEIRERSLVALLGGSGSGKSTVLNCLNGMDQSGVEGQILFFGEDLYQNFDRLKYLIGVVPQGNLIHGLLTVEEELLEAARLRLPGDTTRKEIDRQVDATIQMLGLEGVRRSRIHKLSGGEQKRVNIGIELVADRSLLCLDEPDAGLDPSMKRELFLILRRLARENGKTIVVIFHDVADIDLFDQVIMLAKMDEVGRLAFSGSPEAARKYFGVSDFRQAYALLAENPRNYIKE